MPTLQSLAAAAVGCAEADVPTAIAAIRLVNANAYRKQLVTLLSDFVFMIILLSNFLLLFWPYVTSHRGRPFPTVH